MLLFSSRGVRSVCLWSARMALVTGLGASCILAGAALASCILVDPPAELPVEPARRPTILHESVVPPTTTILQTWPSQGFLLPVDVDPAATFSWEAFLDYDPVLRPPMLGSPGTSSPDPASEDGGVRLIELRLPPPDDLTACHTLEIIVALVFDAEHTPRAPGGDSVVWFYSPTGDLRTCPSYDGGAGFIDASDASDAGLGDGSSE